MWILGENKSSDKAQEEPTATIRINGKEVANYFRPPPPPITFGPRRHRQLNNDVFAGPKLKIERAKHHIRDLEAAIGRFNESNPYELVVDKDVQTGESVFRLMQKQEIPPDLSGIVGDAIHNLRSVLDFLVCDLIRANNETPGPNSGLPIRRTAKRLEPGSIGKIKGVSANAERCIFRLYRYGRWNSALYALNLLDVFDKHNCIVPTAAATFNATARAGMPFGFTEDSRFVIGQMMYQVGGAPSRAGRVYPLYDGVELHRSPSGLDEEFHCAVLIAFGKGEVLEGEPILPTLHQLAELVERVLILAERRAL